MALAPFFHFGTTMNSWAMCLRAEKDDWAVVIRSAFLVANLAHEDDNKNTKPSMSCYPSFSDLSRFDSLTQRR